MKKSKLKKTRLKRETISNFKVNSVMGGISYQPGCNLNTTPPRICFSFGNCSN